MINKEKLKRIREKNLEEQNKKTEERNIGVMQQLEMELANKETQRLQMQERLNDALQRIEELEGKAKS